VKDLLGISSGTFFARVRVSEIGGFLSRDDILRPLIELVAMPAVDRRRRKKRGEGFCFCFFFVAFLVRRQYMSCVKETRCVEVVSRVGPQRQEGGIPLVSLTGDKDQRPLLVLCAMMMLSWPHIIIGYVSIPIHKPILYK
jgi:hypothetical protein